MTRVCENDACGKEYPYDPARPTQVYCSVNCRRMVQDRGRNKNTARDASRAAHEVEFIGVDGEGMDVVRLEEMYDNETEQVVMKRVRRHEYILISVGDKSYHNNGKMLHHEEIFNFLYDQKLAHPDAAFVGFFLGYDFSQWLKTLPESRGFLLFHPLGIAKRQPKSKDMHFPFPVYCRGWEIDILGMKRFKLRPRVEKKDRPQCVTEHKTAELIEACATGAHNKHPFQWMYICDAGSFFQCMLLTAINREKWLPGTQVVTEEEYAILEHGKENRPNAVFGPAMIEYNVLENEVLARLMKTVNDGFVADGIKLKVNQWFGPGQAAQTWMRNIGLPTGEKVREVVPEWAIEAARQSYYGGWFEIMFHGPVTGTTYSYDINSAYPYGIAQLPCLMHGEWSHGTGKPPYLPRGAYQLIDARVSGRDMFIGAMPHRDAAGRIVRPQKTAGWYWQHEIDAARKAGVLATASVDHWVRYQPCDCPPPVAAIAGLYESRLRVNKNSPYGKSKKLVYNSAYGKFAQSIGQPRFSNSLYASLITAHCRTMILQAIGSHPDKSAGVAMVATDSVTFLTPHPTLDKDDEVLGKWGETKYENLSLMMPGLYWTDKSRETIAAGKAPSLKSRGVSAKDLAQFIDKIDAMWAKMIATDSEFWFSDEAPEIDIKVAFSIVSPKLAMHRNNWEDCGRVQWNETRKLSANPESKRCGMYPATDKDGAIRSHVYTDIPGEPRTHPYDKSFGAELDPTHVLEEWLTPDGTIGAAIASVIPR